VGLPPDVATRSLPKLLWTMLLKLDDECIKMTMHIQRRRPITAAEIDTIYISYGL